MSKIQISEDILPLGQFKTQASQLLKKINQDNRAVVITQNGKPAAVMLSPNEYDRLNNQCQFLAAMQEGLNDEQSGRIIEDDALDSLLDSNLSGL